MEYYKSNGRIVYKSADRYVIYLQLSRYSITNMHRKNVINRHYAKFRTDEAKVIKIEDKINKTCITSIKSDHDKNFIYTVNDVIKIKDYDYDCNKVCGTGIHFFLTYKAAFHHNIIYKIHDYTGKYKA